MINRLAKLIYSACVSTCIINIAIPLLLLSCSSVHKSTKTEIFHKDSSSVQSSIAISSSHSDSTGKTKEAETYTKETLNDFVLVPVPGNVQPDSQLVYSIDPNDYFTKPVMISTGKQNYIALPRTRIKETGTKTKEQESQKSNSDTASKEDKKTVTVNTDSKITERNKSKLSFSWWWLLLLLLLLLVPKVREKIMGFIKRL